MDVEIFALSDVGLARTTNEDAMAVVDLDAGASLPAGAPHALALDGARRGPLFVVCDGMGGAAGGEIASTTAAEVVRREMLAARPTRERAVFARHLRRSIRAAHQALLEAARARPELRGMGSTVSAAGLVGDALIIAQVGDSRAYVARGGQLTQVTHDQSVVSALVHAGRLSEAEARLSDQRSLILQALGSGDDVEVALSIVELRRGDRLLLCSDGLHGPVTDAAIRYALGAHPPLPDACRALLGLAHQGGAPDNTTIILARFDGDGLAEPTAGEPARFTEFDPREGADGAVADTSWVVRRLAVRAGLRDDTLPPALPPTGQHQVARRSPGSTPAPAAAAAGGPADALLRRRARLGLYGWLIAAVVALALAVVLLRGLP